MLAIAVLLAWFASWCARVFIASREDVARFANVQKARDQAATYGIAVGVLGLTAGLGSLALVGGAVLIMVWKEDR